MQPNSPGNQSPQANPGQQPQDPAQQYYAGQNANPQAVSQNAAHPQQGFPQQANRQGAQGYPQPGAYPQQAPGPYQGAPGMGNAYGYPQQGYGYPVNQQVAYPGYPQQQYPGGQPMSYGAQQVPGAGQAIPGQHPQQTGGNQAAAPQNYGSYPNPNQPGVRQGQAPRPSEAGSQQGAQPGPQVASQSAEAAPGTNTPQSNQAPKGPQQAQGANAPEQQQGQSSAQQTSSAAPGPQARPAAVPGGQHLDVVVPAKPEAGAETQQSTPGAQPHPQGPADAAPNKPVEAPGGAQQGTSDQPAAQRPEVPRPEAPRPEAQQQQPPAQPQPKAQPQQAPRPAKSKSKATAGPEEIAARAEKVSKVYGSGDAEVVALRGVSLQIKRNEFTAIMGPSGSGKSTLMHCMAGLDRATDGATYVGDINLADLTDKQITSLRRDKLGFIFQSFNLVPTLTAKENITLPSDVAGRSVDEKWFEEVVNRLGLENRLSHRPAELSGGQQQRVACARALVSRPELIFGDEPTGNLDSNSSREVLQILRNAVDQFKQTVVIVTHDPKAASYADRVVFLADGRLVAELRDPTSDAVLAMMSEIEKRY